MRYLDCILGRKDGTRHACARMRHADTATQSSYNTIVAEKSVAVDTQDTETGL